MTASDTPSVVDIAFWIFGVAAVFSGWRVFRTQSMVRATFLLLASFLCIGVVMLMLTAEYVGFAVVFMMALEMIVMVLFMVMFMMNPAGLNPMRMVHQHRIAVVAGASIFGGLSAVALATDFPEDPIGRGAPVIEQLGAELLGDSMLTFELAGVTLLAAMIAGVALSANSGRFGAGADVSLPPPLDPATGERPEDHIEIESRHGHGGQH